jgi:hypothetical protein
MTGRINWTSAHASQSGSSMLTDWLGYAGNTRVGAITYNAVHTAIPLHQEW